ncbi:MAG: hypothetical protein KKD63_09695 [Proteobacteria bacterium]|nr:hypothetical protein [Desulfobulbaceae bacterium]MBU4153142.1 hypothetical protein [Pseudomonadota bacterium]MDP2106250.1 hypothetical protein [Desulfobulbaceae bacterium]
MKKIDPKLIAFDIDGVVADTAEAFFRLAQERHGINEFTTAHITEFDVAKCLPIAPEIIDSIFASLLEDPINADLQPMPDSVSVLTTLSRLAPLTFITARPLHPPIANWLKYILGPTTFAKVNLIAMGDHDKKAVYLKDLKLQYFIDDRAETCVDLKQQGFSPLVFNQPWNLGRHQLPSVSSWREIEALCT